MSKQPSKQPAPSNKLATVSSNPQQSKSVTNVFKQLGSSVNRIGNELNHILKEPNSAGSNNNITSNTSLSKSSSYTDTNDHIPVSQLNVVLVLSHYIESMLQSVSGMKSLLVDSETSLIISQIYTQTDLLKHNVLLIENIDLWPLSDADRTTALHHMKATVFIRPTKHSLLKLGNILCDSQRYTEYYIFYTNIVSPSYLDQLSEHDTRHATGLIKSVHEYYGDYYAVSPNLIHMNTTTYNLYHTIRSAKVDLELITVQQLQYNRDLQCILSLLLSLNKKSDIRYSVGSEQCKRIAQEINIAYKQNTDLFNSMPQSIDNSVLLILDRRDDIVTPLITPWSYHAMIHELLCIHNNQVDMSHTDYTGPGSTAQKRISQLVLSSSSDQFDVNHRYSNFGDLGVAVKKLVDRYQVTHKTNAKLDSLDDMSKFMDNYTEFKQEQTEVYKHMALFTELNRIIKSRLLMACSELEQELVCGNSPHQDMLDRLLPVIQDSRYDYYDKLRLYLLYSIRYESHTSNAIQHIKQVLQSLAVSPQDKYRCNVCEVLLNYGGHNVRKSDLFHETVSVKQLLRKAKTTVSGIDNIYTQHKPLLHTILNELCSGDLKTTTHQYIDSTGQLSSRTKYRHIIVYIMGGVTYAESQVCDQIMKDYNVKVVLGGTYIHRSQSFLDELLPVPDQIKESIVDIDALKQML